MKHTFKFLTVFLLALLGANLQPAWGAKNYNWYGNVFFRAPDDWDLDNYPHVQLALARTTSTSTSTYLDYFVEMQRVGTTRLYYTYTGGDHSTWNKDEYVFFTANSSNWGSCDNKKVNENTYYTTPVDYGFSNNDYPYLFNPTTEGNGASVSGSCQSSGNDYGDRRHKLLNKEQKVNLYTNGSLSKTGGSVKIEACYVSGNTSTTSGSSTSSGTSVSYNAGIGSDVTLTATANTGYSFVGWYTEETGGSRLSPDATYTYRCTGEKTIYARFAPPQTIYFINTFIDDNVSAYVYDGSDVYYKAWPGEAMTNTGNKKNGFDIYSYTFPNNYTRVIFVNSNNTNNKSGDLTWSASKPYFYNVNWYAQSELPNFMLIGSYCDWSTSTAKVFDNATGTVTVDSIWGGMKVYFGSSSNSFGAYQGSETLKKDNKAYGMLEGSDSKNFVFEADYTNAVFKLTQKTTSSDNKLQLTFVSGNNPRYAINYFDKGGSAFTGNHADGHPTIHTYGTATTLKSATKTGYDFEGWYTIQGCTSGKVTTLAATSYKATINLYANWVPKKYDIIYKETDETDFTGWGGTIHPTQHTYGTPTTIVDAPNKVGYTFGGWYSEKELTNKITILGADAYTADITLYAKWVEAGRTITFGVETGSVTMGELTAKHTTSQNAITSGEELPLNTPITFTATPATADYVVEGWYSNAACTSRIAAAKAHTEYSITLTENTEVYVKFAQAYTVHFGEIGDLINKGELAVTYYDESIVDGAQVAEGSNVVFSATNLASNYTVQGWFADQQAKNSLEGVSGYAVSDDRKTLTATISEDVNVYVRYFAPEIVSAIALKVDGAVPTVYQIGETITAEPTTTGGDGTKVYNWQLKQDGVPVTTTFSPDGKKVSFNVESTGNYTITLTINDATTGFFNSTCTSAAFAVNEPVYYIIGASFWGTSENDLKTLHEKAMSGEYAAMGCNGTKDVHLQPTMEKGVYSFGAWRYGNDYYYFWIYDAVKQKVLSNSNSQSYYLVGGDHKTYDQGVQLTGISLGNNSLSTKGNNDQYTDLGQEGHNWYMYIKNNKMWFTENAPDLTAYVRLVVTADKQYYSNEILMPEDGAQSEILSFYSNAEATKYEIQKQEPGKGWQKLKDVAVSSICEGGIYTITFTKSGDDITMGTPAAYTGDYYVRTDALNSWDDYKTNPKAKMRYTEGARNNAFNYYLCKWCDNENINVHFAVANDYNSNLLGTYTNDVICTEGKLLGQKASVRFMFMHKTGELARAYLCGTIEDQFLRVINNQTSSKKIYSDAAKTQEVTDLKFEDSQDFVYPIDVYAQPGAQIALRAKYKNYYQFFYGAGNADGTVTSYDYLIGDNTSTDNNAYHMQMVYDFKTDRLVAGWIPGNEPISGKIDLHSDAIITREHQGDLRSIRFANDKSGVLHVKTLYAELQLNKSIMTDGHTQEATYIYDRNIYWISFPFDVRVGDIFGVDGYGTKWVIQKYNGAKRAQIGWFAETATFWEQMDEDDIMEANVGYSLNLDPDFFDQESDEVWSNGKASVSFRFPSMIHNFDVISNGEAQSFIPKHTCTIDRTFGDGKNHKVTDSNWNVFGIPTFQDLVNPTGLPFASYYEYVPATNSYTAQATTEGNNFTLKASYSYFVQWGREELVTWPKASIINKLVAAPYHYADAKNYMVELFFSYGDKEDHTYINLKDEAKQDFVLNEDMMKVTNSGQPNIYSFAGAYDVAYNATTFENQTVNLGVIARKNGSYTFAMPKDFSGKAVLVDLESGEATDLNLSDYTVELNKGTYNNRFQLLLEVEAKAPTNMNPTKGEWSVDGKTKKLFINDNIYLINAGRIYNASGTQVK